MRIGLFWATLYDWRKWLTARRNFSVNGGTVYSLCSKPHYVHNGLPYFTFQFICGTIQFSVSRTDPFVYTAWVSVFAERRHPAYFSRFLWIFWCEQLICFQKRDHLVYAATLVKPFVVSRVQRPTLFLLAVLFIYVFDFCHTHYIGLSNEHAQHKNRPTVQ